MPRKSNNQESRETENPFMSRSMSSLNFNLSFIFFDSLRIKERIMHFKWKFLFLLFNIFFHIKHLVFLRSTVKKMFFFYNDNPILSCFYFLYSSRERAGFLSPLLLDFFFAFTWGENDSVWKDFPSSYFALS